MDNKNYFFTLNNVILKRIILYVCVGGGGGGGGGGRGRGWRLRWLDCDVFHGMGMN